VQNRMTQLKPQCPSPPIILGAVLRSIAHVRPAKGPKRTKTEMVELCEETLGECMELQTHL